MRKAINAFTYGISIARPVRRGLMQYWQPYKGIYFYWPWPPNPEEIKMAQVDFDRLYPVCEECKQTLYICTCMLDVNDWSDV